MRENFIAIMKWVMPLVTIIICLLVLLHIHIPQWLGLSLLIVTAILYAIAFIMERKFRRSK